MSDTTVYAVASGKGGVGKTTTTANLGTALASAGRRVAIVDADLGMANLAGFVSLSPDGATLHDVLAGEASVPEATYEVADGIAAVPSGDDLDGFAGADAAGLADVVERLRGEFDEVLLDVGAGVSHEAVLPLGVADEVLLVSTPEPAAMQDVRKTIDLTDRAGGAVAGLLVNRARPDGDVDHEEIADRLGVPLLGTVPDDGAVRDSVYAGTPVVAHDPETPAAKAYRSVAATLVGADGAADESTDAERAAAAEESDDDADGTDASVDPAAPETVEEAVESVEDDPAEADADAAEGSDETGPGTGDAEAADENGDADEAEEDADGVTIPDAEADADGAADEDEDEDEDIDLDDDAIPFQGDDSAPVTPSGSDDESDEDEDEEKAEEEGGFLSGIF